ncbi:MAG TPA: peptide deformylase [Candidatus Limnocylindria bacterium]|nr:peptide deformylase [Candidatus Limnocylindria bacterium]
MALLTVRLYGDPVLRQVATPVRDITAEIERIIADMTETMWHQVGIGLAATQVGLPYRILVMDDGKGGAQALINPVIESRSGTIREEEGCLSLPGVFGVVERSKTISVKAVDADGKPVSLEATGLKARIVQHELDHLDGVLFIDRLPPVTRDRIKKKIQKEGFPKEMGNHAFAL